MKIASSPLKKSILPAQVFCFFFLFILSLPKDSFSQNNASKNFAIKSDWSANPFHQNAFIENKGQFDDQDGIKNSEIIFGIQNDGVEIYFTPKGLTYKHNE